MITVSVPASDEVMDKWFQLFWGSLNLYNSSSVSFKKFIGLNYQQSEYQWKDFLWHYNSSRLASFQFKFDNFDNAILFKLKFG